MIFSLIITGSPVSSEAPSSALRFAGAALENGHQIYRIFLQGDGVLCATRLATAPQDEIDIHQQWRELSEQFHLDVIVCIASALKRGIIDANESVRYNKEHFNLARSMELGGLGQLIDAANHSDRIITFGP